MTAKERAVIQAHINKMTEIDREKDRAFYAIQALNVEHGDGTKWCSPDANLAGVLANGDELSKGRAKYQYRLYFEACAKEDLLRELGQGLADIGFWKNRT